MTEAKLLDGTRVFCLRKQEALVLDSHVDGYLQHGIDIEENDIIFDVGANIGMFGLRAFQRFKSLRVFAFEPIPSIHKVLEANAMRFGGKAYHALNYGLSDAAGELNFTYFPNAPALSSAHMEDWQKDPNEFKKSVAGAFRTAPLWYMRWIPSFMAGFIAKRLQANAQQVRCPLRTVSDVMDEHNLPRIDLLKIDCEGAELPVLQGIRDEHWAVIRKVVIEVHDVDGRLEAIKAILKKQGFENIVEEKEAGFEQTTMINLFTHR